MRLRHITGSEERIAESPFVVDHPWENKGAWGKVFDNGNPIRIEVGTGKGRFLTELARRNPDINYVGIERYSSVLLKALHKLDGDSPGNIRFVCMDADKIEEVFGPGEVDRIYLNFSDPWPKERHARRRLPSRQFLNKFDTILKTGGRLEFKTDNRALFDFAVGELEPAGWKAEAVTYDLHHDGMLSEGNIMTEYEEKFSSVGHPIHKYIIYR